MVVVVDHDSLACNACVPDTGMVVLVGVDHHSVACNAVEETRYL